MDSFFCHGINARVGKSFKKHLFFGEILQVLTEINGSNALGKEKKNHAIEMIGWPVFTPTYWVSARILPVHSLRKTGAFNKARQTYHYG